MSRFRRWRSARAAKDGTGSRRSRCGPAASGRASARRSCAAGLDALRHAGARGCVVLGEPAYYARFGFGPAGDIVFPQAPPDALMALPFGEHAPRPAGALRYHASFYA